MKQKRISVLRVPLDYISEEQIDERIHELLENQKINQICFITFRDIMRAQFNRDLRQCFKNSALNIPITVSARFAAVMLNKNKPVVHNPFTFIIRLLGVLEKYQKSIYILGSRKKNIQLSDKNLRASFPGLQIVGRYAGTYSRQDEMNVLTAIKKSSPALLLTGKGLKGKNLWLYRNSQSFNPGLIMWGRSCFEVFSGNKKKPRNMKGMAWLREMILAVILPWRLLSFILFFIMLTVDRIRFR